MANILIIEFESITPEKSKEKKKERRKLHWIRKTGQSSNFWGEWKRPHGPPCDLPWKSDEEVGGTFCCRTVFFRIFFWFFDFAAHSFLRAFVLFALAIDCSPTRTWGERWTCSNSNKSTAEVVGSPLAPPISSSNRSSKQSMPSSI